MNKIKYKINSAREMPLAVTHIPFPLKASLFFIIFTLPQNTKKTILIKKSWNSLFIRIWIYLGTQTQKPHTTTQHTPTHPPFIVGSVWLAGFLGLRALIWLEPGFVMCGIGLGLNFCSQYIFHRNSEKVTRRGNIRSQCAYLLLQLL